MNQKTDITMYSEDELSLRVFNEEELYRERHDPNFKKMIEDTFIYTRDQLITLCRDLAGEYDNVEW
jgi:hypothetical protein